MFLLVCGFPIMSENKNSQENPDSRLKKRSLEKGHDPSPVKGPNLSSNSSFEELSMEMASPCPQIEQSSHGKIGAHHKLRRPLLSMSKLLFFSKLYLDRWRWAWCREFRSTWWWRWGKGSEEGESPSCFTSFTEKEKASWKGKCKGV